MTSVPNGSASRGPLFSGEADKATFTMEDGTSLTGYSFGAAASAAGEVVFNTGMVGYPEALSDPSYRGQILVLTYPLVGNYGVPDSEETDAFGLKKWFESDAVHVRGLVVSSYSLQHSHWNSTQSLGHWLKKHGVPAIYGVDTRMLTKKIRTRGSMLGKIEMRGESVEFDDPNKGNLVAEVSTKTVRVFGQGQRPRILAYDCGIKFNIIRYLVGRGVELTVVPYDFDLKPVYADFDGIFVSNGPGNPEMASETIESLRWALTAGDKPIFGICLGNQLLALAAGARTYKMKYGNRGMNQPCIDMRTTRCYVTPQNHGFAVDSDSLPDEWKTFFVNANDHSNEGIIHASKPFFSVQFHPEACGGPTDTAFLFDMFLRNVSGLPRELTLVDTRIYNQAPVRKVLLVGSGGLSIGQAGEFDYSGSQAIKALKEEGVEVVLVNPNIATVQTSKGMADSVYFVPITPEFVLDIIKKERPDSILVSMGGQTALNVGCKLANAGHLERHGVRVLGTQIPVIEATEDRELFAKTLAEIGERAARSIPATTVDEAVAAANTIGFPVLLRAAYALGGLGSGFASNEEELRLLASKAFATSSQILIDEDLRGWKEVEYEVVRDIKDNCVTVCNMENFDPLGIHTGDSIVIAPSQTLSNSEYFKLRQVALKVVRHLGVVGECNIQYALHPESERYCIIEVNARLSRSSALASKATGYPLAYVAAKLALGADLVTIRNSVTQTTTACFEPSLDYCVVKVPRWDLKKFDRVSNALGSSMKSVGEVMAIGRSFEETIQKAVRMVDPSLDGFESGPARGVAHLTAGAELDDALKNPTFQRLFVVAKALELGYTVERIHALTRIDRWFLTKLARIDGLRRGIEEVRQLSSITEDMMLRLKRAGFADRQIAKSLQPGTEMMAVRRLRVNRYGITPCVKQIDTLAAEFPAQTNYLYMTYSGTEDDVVFDDPGVIVLGCGPYCIGSSVEFDWCAVSCVRTLRENGFKATVINYNPETVSTDYDESDRLYFEELSFERTLDIYERERSNGVIVSVGGQIPNCMAVDLHRNGCNVLGTPPMSIDRAEDRNKFSALLDQLGVDQPPWCSLATTAEAVAFSEKVGFPVLVRPSYVLSGAAMNVASNEEELQRCLDLAGTVSKDCPVVISKFILNAKEIEFDAVADHGRIVNYAISEHVENAGVHSGDATLVLPAQKLYVETIRKIKRISSMIADALQISGPFNIQFMSRNNDVKVIECNLRASRTFPFISKTFDFNFISLATKIMVGLPVKPHDIRLLDLDYVGVKAPMFSFTRLQGADPTLGVEMASTGEVACFGANMGEALLKALMSTGFRLPRDAKAKTCLLTLGPRASKEAFVDSARLLERMGFTLFGTPGTADHFAALGISIGKLAKPSSGEGEDCTDFISSGKIGMVINVPETLSRTGVTDGYQIRRCAVDYGVALLTNLKCAIALVDALHRVKELEPRTMEEYYRGAFTPLNTNPDLSSGGALLKQPSSPRSRRRAASRGVSW